MPIAAPMARRVAAHDRAQRALEDRQRVVRLMVASIVAHVARDLPGPDAHNAGLDRLDDRWFEPAHFAV